MKLQKIAFSSFKYLTLSILVLVFPFNSAEAWKVRNYSQDGIGIKCSNCGWIAMNRRPVGFAEEINCPASTDECSTTSGPGSGPVQITYYFPKSFVCEDQELGNKLPPHGVMEIYQDYYWIYPDENTNDGSKAAKFPTKKLSLVCPQSN